MMTAHRCQAPGCGRFVRAGASHCPKHDLRQADVVDETPVDDRAERRLAFLERLEQGEYAALFDDNLSRIISQAAKAMQERGPDSEIGALRVVLARLMAEEQDPAKLAASVTRVASAAVQAARAQRAISGESAEGLTTALTQILVELDEG